MVSPTHVPFEGTLKDKKTMTGRSVATWHGEDIPCVCADLLAIFLTAMFAGMIYLGIDGIRNGYGFWKLTLRFIVLLYVMKAFDIIVQDQWLVMTLGYFKKIFPETADCVSWKNRGFNNKNHIIRIIAYPFLCMITAGVFMLVKGLIG